MAHRGSGIGPSEPLDTSICPNSNKTGTCSIEGQAQGVQYCAFTRAGWSYDGEHCCIRHNTARKIDDEVKDLINLAYDKSKQVLKENMDILHELAGLLLEKETVMGAELDALIHEMRPGIKLPSKPTDTAKKEDTSHAEQAAKSEQPEQPEPPGEPDTPEQPESPPV